jgi:hypothetical protein
MQGLRVKRRINASIYTKERIPLAAAKMENNRGRDDIADFVGRIGETPDRCGIISRGLAPRHHVVVR